MFHHILNRVMPPDGMPDDVVIHGWSHCGQVAQTFTAGQMREAVNAGHVPPPVGFSPCPACVAGMTGMAIGPADCACDPVFIDERCYIRHTESITDCEHDVIAELIDAVECPAERRALVRLLVARDGTYLPRGVRS